MGDLVAASVDVAKVSSVTLAGDWPGAVKGTVLTKDGDVYRDDKTGLWVHADAVEKQADKFIIDVADAPTFFVANLDGTVTQATAASEKDVQPNWFRDEKLALVAALKLAELLKSLRG